MIERVIKIYTDKFSQFSNTEFAVVDEKGKMIARTKNFENFEKSVKVELNSNYGKIYLYIKGSSDVEREVQLLKFLYTELLNYEGYIENLVQELAHRQEELGIVYDIIAKASLVFDESEIVKIIIDKIRSLISPRACVVGIFESGRLNQKYTSGEILRETSEDAEKLIEKAIETRNFVISSVEYQGRVKGMLAVPMFSGAHQIGGIFVCDEGRNFETADAKLLLTLGNYAGIILYRNKLIDEIKRTEALKQEIEIAKRIQENLLPKKIPECEGLDVCAFIKPSSSVGGDYYDFISNGKKNAFLVMDVSGHGIGAALLLSSLRSVVRLMYEITPDISELLSAINRVIYKDTSEIGMYSTIFMCEYYPEGFFVYSNAGHVPPILFKRDDGSMFELEIHGSPIGLFDDEKYGSDRIEFSKGDIIVAFTDGVTEARNSNGEFFGVERLKNIIAQNFEKSSDEICDVVVSEVMNFQKDVEQKDDITLLILKKI
ncbi:PP2C family protein-serine/threonine phosphatase [Candidatus Chrysopegis kryptomonas]|uniref:GAF domain-containing protein n=1 Tax=Candidatus Chryseopegocella kryptomonas TaxID=1633643 RepID=A0A0P1NTY3_9BACT|nr:GAF domain-containing SpoIIE family protein phosphatase [Candidatus Chrysopegis kryptomonas]CUT02560.1 GAF domain-containing protein [Candidatus Chrysopegis kryptomonas]